MQIIPNNIHARIKLSSPTAHNARLPVHLVASWNHSIADDKTTKTQSVESPRGRRERGMQGIVADLANKQQSDRPFPKIGAAKGTICSMRVNSTTARKQSTKAFTQ
jgi:hypothetical protein